MILDWSKKDMERRLKELESTKKKDLKTKFNIGFYKISLSDASITKTDSLYKIQTKEEMINEIRSNIGDFIKYFRQMPKKVRISFFTMVDLLRSLYIDIDDIKIKNQNLSNQSLFDTSYKIYGKISPYFTRVLDYIYKNNLIKVGSCKYDDMSWCYNETENNLGYAYICKKTPDKISSEESTYNHELMHSIISTINPGFYRFPHLEETHSIYMGLKTDRILYDETKNPIYLKSEYNYMTYLQRILLDFAMIRNIIMYQEKITEKTLINAYQDLTGVIIEEGEEDRILNYFYDLNLIESFGYLLSGICAIHLLEQEDELQRRNFIDASFNTFKTDKEFLKFINMDFDDTYYMGDIFNKAGCDIKAKIRKLK